MARPTTHLDLPEWDRRGSSIVTWDSDILSYPELAEHIVQAQKAAKALGSALNVERDGIYKAPTTEELDAKLRRAQEAWDSSKRAYEVAQEFGATDRNELWRINQYARSEGLPLMELQGVAA